MAEEGGSTALTRFDRELRDLSQLLDALPPIPAIAEAAEEVREELPALRNRRQTVERCLVVVLLGGTGVGKSTLLNAIAGQGIARVSRDVRPCTRTFTAYAPAGTDPSVLAPFQDDDRLVLHSEQGLHDKIIVDCPDLDSTEEANRDRLLSLLPHADLVAMVVTRQKYKDEALYRVVTEQLATRTASFIVIANQQDRDGPGYLSDLERTLVSVGIEQPRIFPLSASEAFLAKQGGDTLPAPWQRLEDYLRLELDRQRVREMKRVGLEGTLRQARERLLLPLSGPLAAVPALRRELDGVEQEIVGELLASVEGALADSGPVMGRLLLNRLSQQLGGPFGLWLQVDRRLRHLLSPAGVAVAGVSRLSPLYGLLLGAGWSVYRELREGGEEKALTTNDTTRSALIRPELAERVSARVGAVRQELIGAGIQPAEATPETDFEEMAQRLLAVYGRGLDERLAAAATRLRAPWLAMALNLVPAALLAWGLWHLVEGLLRSSYPPVDFYLALGSVLAAACAVQGAALRWASQRTGRQLLGQVSSLVQGQAQAQVALLLAPLGATLTQVESWRRALPPPRSEDA